MIVEKLYWRNVLLDLFKVDSMYDQLWVYNVYRYGIEFRIDSIHRMYLADIDAKIIENPSLTNNVKVWVEHNMNNEMKVKTLNDYYSYRYIQIQAKTEEELDATLAYLKIVL